jgi:M-phase inducer phosphatase 2/M-phase inducer phosphatase
LIADFSAPYALPRCKSKHSDLQAISPETVSSDFFSTNGVYGNNYSNYIQWNRSHRN